MKVMIVDDDKSGRESLQALLSICNIDVLAASNGQHALEVAENTELDIAVVDWMLGDHTDGLRLADMLTEIQPELRIIVISGQLNVEAQVSQHPQHRFLMKPFQLAELLALFNAENGDTGSCQKIR